MSRIAESVKGLRQERRAVASQLAKIDKLLRFVEVMQETQPRRRRRVAAKSKPSKPPTARKPRKSAGKGKEAPAGNLAAATE